MKFINDKNIDLVLPKQGASNRMEEWSKSEKCLRLLVTEMIDKKLITNNIIDLGAYVGDNAVPWGFNYPDIQVYAIDPSEANCKYIELFATQNSIKNVKVICKAVSDKNQVVSTNSGLGHCSFQVNESGKNKVNSVSLDYLYAQSIIDNVGFLHLDVEGMEFNVIKGASSLINRFKPVIIFEQHTRTEPYKEICKHLKSTFGYETYMIPEVCGARQDCRNFLSIQPSLAESITKLNHGSNLILQ
jgi:FkbM family methyltransferase|tara:strand:- start:35 stop:766 length:732 start_codon:yes stop_codon:yes gene_type:complete